MPIPCFFLLAYATGVIAAIASRAELRLSPRPAVMCHSFGGYALFLGLLFLPVTSFFYLFHGDWSLLYVVDVRTIPSAVALLGLLMEGAMGVVGFVSGSTWVRNQRTGIALIAAACATGACAVLLFFVGARLSLVGTYAQFQAGVGLKPYTDGALLQSTLWLGALLVAGFFYLVSKLLRYRTE